MSGDRSRRHPPSRWEVLRRLDDADVADVVAPRRAGHRARRHAPAVRARHAAPALRRRRRRAARPRGASDGALVGYAHLDVTDQVDGPSAELAVAPAYRRHGLGRQLVEQLIAEIARRPAAAVGARRAERRRRRSPARMGFRRSRMLWQMRRSLYAAAAATRCWPAGVRLRSFLPGPRRRGVAGRSTRAPSSTCPTRAAGRVDDLHVRMREPWFDPDGLPRRVGRADGERMVGFHWTKVHGADAHHHGHVHAHAHDGQAAHEHAHDGRTTATSRSARCTSSASTRRTAGTGSGARSPSPGCSTCAPLDLPDAMLYVDAENTAAIALYESLGFTPLGHRRASSAAERHRRPAWSDPSGKVEP